MYKHVQFSVGVKLFLVTFFVCVVGALTEIFPHLKECVLEYPFSWMLLFLMIFLVGVLLLISFVHRLEGE